MKNIHYLKFGGGYETTPTMAKKTISMMIPIAKKMEEIVQTPQINQLT